MSSGSRPVITGVNVMGMAKTASLGSLIAVVLLAGGGPASAEEVPPANTDSTVATAPPTGKTKGYHKGVGVEQANHNGTSRTAKSTFTSEVSSTVGVAATGEVKVSLKQVVAEEEVKFGVTLSVSLTAKIGNTISVDTRSHKTTYARYGVFRLKSYGYSQYTYYNRYKGTKKNSTIYTPRRVGWAIWES
ncbi:hypothetical protein GTY41_05395 [Streptomyces sp. SID685]|uniref:hypothetical protein n=1 Tax=Streptomyces TaxID=1883 RepID=UPI00136A4DB0|nr:hypothetical protein [Streptomyces sp. SID685]MYR84397.1 hypothetical protein [Streptomyces sp. SID685]